MDQGPDHSLAPEGNAWTVGRGPGLVSRCSLFPTSMASGRHPMSFPLPPSSRIHCSEWPTASSLPHLGTASCCTQALPDGVRIPGEVTHVQVRETPSASLMAKTVPPDPPPPPPPVADRAAHRRAQGWGPTSAVPVHGAHRVSPHV